MNIPVDWPETVTVSTRDLVATLRFLDMHGFEFAELGSTGQDTADRACRAFDPLCMVLDVKCPGWL